MLEQEQADLKAKMARDQQEMVEKHDNQLMISRSVISSHERNMNKYIRENEALLANSKAQ